MGVIRRQSAVSSVLLYASIALGFVLSLYIYPKYLDAEEIGLIRVFLDIAQLLTPFLLLGVPNTFVKYFPYFKDESQKAGAFRFLSIMVAGIGTVVSLLVFAALMPLLSQTFEENSPLMVDFLMLVPAIIFMKGGITLIRAFYRSDFDIVTPNLYESLVLKALFVVCVLAYSTAGLGVEWLIYFYLIAHAMVFLAMLISYQIRHGFRLNAQRGFIEPQLRKEIVFYGFFVIANMISGSMIVKIDTWMISTLSGLEATGIYSIALSIGMVIELPKRTITQIAVPVIANNWKNGNFKNIREVYHKTSLNQLLAGAVIFILVWSSIDDLFLMIPNGDTYVAGKWVVLFIGLSKLFAIATGCNIEILQVSEHYRYSLYTRALLVATAIGTNLYFIPIYGITGAAIATAISVVVNNLVLFVLIWWKLGMQPFRWSNLWASLTMGAVLVIAMFWPSMSGIAWLDIVIRSSAVGLVLLATIWFFPFAADFKGLLLAAIKKVR